MKAQRVLILIISPLVIIGLFLSRCSAPDTATQGIFEALQHESLTALTLETDLGQLRDKSDTTKYQNAKITIQNAGGTKDTFDIKIKLRGETRKRMCYFPPLKLKFASSDLKQRGLKNYNSLKMVVPCHEGKNYQQILFKEYLAYKMYNCLTDKSFRVQLVQLTCADSKNVVPTFTHYGFIIENEAQVADRLQGKLMKKSSEPMKSIDRYQYQLFTLYQYMIGNTDWNLSNQHNLRILQIEDASGPAPIPYDFDFSGLVDAPYAKPYPTLPIQDVKERFFQFRSKTAVDFCPIIDLFIQKKPEIIAICHELDHLDESIDEEMHQYLESFFEIIESSQGDIVAGED